MTFGSVARLSALAALLTASASAWAQDEEEEVDDSLARVSEIASVRLRYGGVLRRARHTDAGPGLSYSGLTGDDLGVYGTAFGSGSLGLMFEFARESLTIVQGDTALRGNILVRGQLGLAARALFGPVRLETSVGYGLSQLPSITETADPRFLLAVRRSIMLGARAIMPLPHKLSAEVRAEVPLTLWSIDGRGRPLDSWGWMGGAAVGRQLFETPSYRVGAWLEYQLARDLAQTASGRTQSQTLSRFGVSAGLSWKGT